MGPRPTNPSPGPDGVRRVPEASMGSQVSCEPKQETTYRTRGGGRTRDSIPPPRRAASGPPLKTRVWPPPRPPTPTISPPLPLSQSPRREGDGKRRGASARGGPGPRGKGRLVDTPRRRRRRLRARGTCLYPCCPVRVACLSLSGSPGRSRSQSLAV